MHDTKLTGRERRYINYCEKIHFANGRFPSNADAARALNYSETDIAFFLQNKKVQKALDRRGISYTEITEITAIQQAVAITVMNVADPRSLETKLEDLGVLPQQYYGWLKNRAFKEYVNQLADSSLGDIRHEAVAAFTKHVRDGNLKAIQMYFDMTGEKKQPDLEKLQIVVQRLLEAVQRHVNDPEILTKISQDVLGAAPSATSNVLQLKGGVADVHSSNH